MLMMMNQNKHNHTRGCTTSYTHPSRQYKNAYQILSGGFPGSSGLIVARCMTDLARRIVPAKMIRNYDLGLELARYTFRDGNHAIVLEKHQIVHRSLAGRPIPWLAFVHDGMKDR